MTAIKHIKCFTAEDLLKTLNNGNSLWNGTRRSWVFRGVRDDNYKLLPSALRPNAQLGFTHTPKGMQSNNRDQIRAEFDRLQEFFWWVDAQGLPLPTDGSCLRTPGAFDEISDKIEEQWPIDDLLPLLALAQHYGVCTRLLDWTENPLVAAYFAAMRHMQSKNKPNRNVLAIWALNLDWVIHTGFPGIKKEMGVYVVTAPRASNPNLHAQSGVFTTELLLKKDQTGKKRVNAKTVDEIVVEQCKKLNCCQTPVMIHMTLSCGEAAELLRRLSEEKIDRAVLFPGYQGVADAMREKSYWDKPTLSSYWLKR